MAIPMTIPVTISVAIISVISFSLQKGVCLLNSYSKLNLSCSPSIVVSIEAISYSMSVVGIGIVAIAIGTIVGISLDRVAKCHRYGVTLVSDTDILLAISTKVGISLSFQYQNLGTNFHLSTPLAVMVYSMSMSTMSMMPMVSCIR